MALSGFAKGIPRMHAQSVNDAKENAQVKRYVGIASELALNASIHQCRDHRNNRKAHNYHPLIQPLGVGMGQTLNRRWQHRQLCRARIPKAN